VKLSTVIAVGFVLGVMWGLHMHKKGKK